MKIVDPPTEEAVEERMLRDFIPEHEAREQLVAEAMAKAKDLEPKPKVPTEPKTPKKAS